MIAFRKYFTLILLVVLIPHVSLQAFAEESVQAALKNIDSIPKSRLQQLLPLLQIANIASPDPFRQFSDIAATGNPGSGPFGITFPSEIQALIQLYLMAKSIWGTFNQLKTYWETLYGQVSYVKTRQFWVAQILDPLASCLPRDVLFRNGLPGAAEIKELLQFIAGRRNYWECSVLVKKALLDMVGGVPYVFDENGQPVLSPNYTDRAWSMYEAATEGPKEVSAARKAVGMMTAEAGRLSGTIFSNQNVPKNTAIAAGHILRGLASESQLQATATSIETQELLDKLRSEKAFEEANSASIEMFRLAPEMLDTSRSE